jgi:DNA-binding winged helix-turn-helix (wHTH) protein
MLVVAGTFAEHALTRFLTTARTSLTIVRSHSSRSQGPTFTPSMKTSTEGTALFGPYALDLRSGELRKFGKKVKIGEQAFQILRVLLETPGEMVTREELRAKLWTSETFVDFDHGLNSAVQRLRDSLSDSAENPRWIETVPRRGYRFIGQVEWSNGSSPSGVLPNPSIGSQDETSADAGPAPASTEPFELTKRARIFGRRSPFLVVAEIGRAHV